MTLENWKNVTDIISNIVVTLAALAGELFARDGSSYEWNAALNGPMLIRTPRTRTDGHLWTLSRFDGSGSVWREVFKPRNRSINGGSTDSARSLLYHALASPNVYPSPAGARTDDDFPTLVELDTIENFIYGVAKKKLKDLGDVVVAVFAYQYRSGSTSVHGKHADMACSRTGIARVGTTTMPYDPFRRSFWPGPAGGTPGVAVMPARYGAFLAKRRKLTAQDAVVHPLNGPIPGDNNNFFLMPVHKLFSGSECLVGENLRLSFQEFHRSEKLRRSLMLGRVSSGTTEPNPSFQRARIASRQQVGRSFLSAKCNP